MSANLLADLIMQVSFEALKAKMQSMSDEEFGLFLLSTPELRHPMSRAARRGDFDDFVKQSWIAEAAAAEAEEEKYPAIEF